MIKIRLETYEIFKDLYYLSNSNVPSTRQYAEDRLIEFYRDYSWLLNKPLDTDKFDLMELNLSHYHFNTFVKYCVISTYQLIIDNKITINYIGNDSLSSYIVYKALSKFEKSYLNFLNLHNNASCSEIDNLIDISISVVVYFIKIAANLNLHIHDSRNIFATKCLQD